MDIGAAMTDERTLRRYLLGQLAGSELESVEERLFANEEFWEALCLVEDDLIDAFVRGELRGADRARFESHFLTSARRRERVAMARVLAGKIAPTARRSWAGVITGLFRQQLSWNMAAAAAALAIILAGALMIPFVARVARERQEIAALKRQVEQLAGQAPARPPAADTTSSTVVEDLQRELRSLAAKVGQAAALSIVLAPGAQRAADQSPQRIVVPPGAQTVQLILPLTAPSAYPSYRAVVQTPEGAEVWGSDELAAASGAGGRSLRLSIPSVALKPGAYRTQVWGLRAGRPPAELDDYYVFEVAVP
jgi:hypothetical protein